MTMFFAGYAAAIATYLLIGACVGVYVISTAPARYFAAGWRWRAMLLTIWDTMLLWPIALLR